MTTKERIVEEAMKLFAVQGFEAVSVRAIAKEVGIGNSALYKHYASKQAIFDAIVEQLKEHFSTQAKQHMPKGDSLEELRESCMAMFRFQTEDQKMVMFRRILLMEQFKDEKMARIYKTFYVDCPVLTQMQVFEQLIEQGYMKKKDARVLSMELYAPFFLYHTVSFDKEKLYELLEKHVDYFFNENLKGEEG